MNRLAPGVLLILTVGLSPALAETPDLAGRTITLIVPFTPGAVSDPLARIRDLVRHPGAGRHAGVSSSPGCMRPSRMPSPTMTRAAASRAPASSRSRARPASIALCCRARSRSGSR
jgi:hypothetical protein